MFPRKYRIHAFLALLALVIIFYPSYSRKPDQQKIDASSVAAVQFLELIDTGDYKQGWQLCASYLKNEISQDHFINQMEAVRSTAGKLIERTQKDYNYTKDPREGIPDSEYMIYHYDSEFEGKTHIIETVTVMLEKDNVWRVAGYFIE